MGYRSEVDILIYGDPEHMQAFIAKHALAGNSWLVGENTRELTRHELTRTRHITSIDNDPAALENGELSKWETTTVTEPMLMLRYHSDGTKWYDEYDDVREMMSMLADVDVCIEEHKWDIAAEFIRLGEESDDTAVERYGSSEHYLGMVRSITCSLDLEPTTPEVVDAPSTA